MIMKKLISDNKDLAYILSLTFSYVFTEENNAVIPTTLNIFQGLHEEKLDLTKIHVNMVHKYKPKLNPNKFIGPDELSL